MSTWPSKETRGFWILKRSIKGEGFAQFKHLCPSCQPKPHVKWFPNEYSDSAKLSRPFAWGLRAVMSVSSYFHYRCNKVRMRQKRNIQPLIAKGGPRMSLLNCLMPSTTAAQPIKTRPKWPQFCTANCSKKFQTFATPIKFYHGINISCKTLGVEFMITEGCEKSVTK